MRSVLWLIPVVMLTVLASCESEPEATATPEVNSQNRSAAPATAFDPSTSGTVSGQVRWIGAKPTAPPFLFGTAAENGNFAIRMVANPNTPVINDGSQTVSGAVVFLRGIDPARARPWDLPPVRVEFKDLGIHVHQGEVVGRVGFVRRGDSIEMQSADSVFHILRARGSAFFSLTFPQAGQPLSRRLETEGRVELMSGSGYYWASADLFVSDHPYFTRTDSNGRFELKQVPPGMYELVTWLPNWNVVKQERDPETGLVFRQTFGPPIERVQKIALPTGGSVQSNFETGLR